MYSSDNNIPKGQIVSIKLKNKVIFGVNYGKVKNIDYTKSKSEKSQKQVSYPNFEVLAIQKVYPYRLNSSARKFIELFAGNTFVSRNLIFDAMLQVFSKYTQKDWQALESLNEQKQKKNIRQFKTEKKITTKAQKSGLDTRKPINIEYHLNSLLWFRIIYLIRSHFNISTSPASPLPTSKSNSQTLLLVFPEKKYLNRLKQILSSPEFLQGYNSDFLANILQKHNLNIDPQALTKPIDPSWLGRNIYYYPDTLRKDKNLSLDLLNSSKDYSSKSKSTQDLEPTSKIILATRSSLFLPFQTLDEIYLIDEASNFYIQEQNSLYFDTREIVYYLAMAYNANLEFLSDLPSSRGYNYNPEKTRQSIL